MKFTPLEVVQILSGTITDHTDARWKGTGRVRRERDRIWRLYFEKHRPKKSILYDDLARAAEVARAEWAAQNLVPEFAYLSFYSEGHGSTVVGVHTDEKSARKAGKGKNWYGGNCDVEKHRVNGEIVYEQSSRVVDKPKPKSRKRRAK